MIDKLRSLYATVVDEWFTYVSWWWEMKAPKLVRVSIVTCALLGWLFAVTLLLALDALCGLAFFCATFVFGMAWICLG